jgi:hypothetical protein
MKIRIFKGHNSQKSVLLNLFPGFIGVIIFLLMVSSVNAAFYHIYGQVTNKYTCTETVPGLEDPVEEECDEARPIPAVTVEVWNADTSTLLGSDASDLYGLYHVEYTAPAAALHTIYFRVLWNIGGEMELLGEVHEKTDGSPIVVDNLLFPYSFYINGDGTIRFDDSPNFSTDGQFMFVEVGNIDMDDIYDQQHDSGFPNKWGLTKDNDSAFGGGLELYGLFGESDEVYYYRIRYESLEGDTDYITDNLTKKNYQIVGSDIVVNRIKMGPLTTTDDPTLPVALAALNVYRLDERLSAEAAYSSYWTEVGLRALWNTAGKNGNYTLSVEAWKHDGTPVAASTNNYATLNLHLVNTPPQCEIHEIQYLDGTTILGGAVECQEVVLNKITASTDDDNIQFEFTARQDNGFMGQYWLRVLHGHDTPDGYVVNVSYSPIDPPIFYGTDPAPQVVVTPPAIASLYQSCAYRFSLHIHPRITNGYDRHIYESEDNWYVCISVVE